jgi:hypothetical protein
MGAILHRFLPTEEVLQISLILLETKGQQGLSRALRSLSIMVKTLGIRKLGNDGGELIQKISLTPNHRINLPQS